MGRPRKRSATSRLSRKSRPGPRGAAVRGGSGGVSITSVGPVGNIGGSSPTVRASVRDRQGTNLSKSDIHVMLDGRAVQNFQYRRMTGNLSFAAGSGKNASKSWSFVVS